MLNASTGLQNRQVIIIHVVLSLLYLPTYLYLLHYQSTKLTESEKERRFEKIYFFEQ